MDIGAPYKLLGQVDISLLAQKIAAVTPEDWEERPVRRASLAGAPHNSARSIVMKHEWMPYASKRGFTSLEDSIRYWCNAKDRLAKEMLPISKRECSDTTVYTFRDWDIWKTDVKPLIREVRKALRSYLKTDSKGVVSRVAFVRLEAQGVIPYHIDQQPLAEKSHRIHVCLSHSPGCVYKVGGQNFFMRPGGIYNFNNRVKHGVHNQDFAPRLNLMLEILPDSEWVAPKLFLLP